MAGGDEHFDNLQNNVYAASASNASQWLIPPQLLSKLKSAAKPQHVIGFELWRKVGGDTEPAFEDMQLVELATRSPHTLDYTSANRGKTVWYASWWVSGGKGPWSEIVSAIVP